MIYLLLFAGLFMGWSLGTNDAANAFGTAVATRIISYKQAIIVIAVLVIAGAFVGGQHNMGKVSELALSNKVLASQEEIMDAQENDDEERTKLKGLRLRSALKAMIIYICAGLTVFAMSFLKFPVSANESITGAVIGWGLYHANYSDPAVLAVNLPQLEKFAITWVASPVSAMLISFTLVYISKRFIEKRLTSFAYYDRLIKIGYLVAGALAAFSIGLNSSANVVTLYYDAFAKTTGVSANLLTNARIAATIGGAAIALGVLTFSRRVMMTVGSSISALSPVDGFLVVIAMAATVVLMGRVMGIPVSTSQAVVGAVVGAGLVGGVKNVRFGVFKRIAFAWLTSPTVSALLTYLAALATRGYFA